MLMLEQGQSLQVGELRMSEVRSPTNTAGRAKPRSAAAASGGAARGAASGSAARDDAYGAALGSAARDDAYGAALGSAARDGVCGAALGSAARDGVCGAALSHAARDGVYRATWGDTALDGGEFLLVVQLDGTSVHHQDDRDATLAPGDFTICSSSRPHQVEALPTTGGTAGGRCLLVAISDALLRRHVTSPDDVVAVHMSGSRGLTGVLSNFIKSLWTYVTTDAIDPAVALRMSYTLLDLIAAAYSIGPHSRHDHSTLVAAHRARIIDYIESHLCAPNLNPTTVARACKITTRYLHHLFTSEPETITQYIQRRRLEECARAMIAAPIRTRLVTEIAFDYGFNSLTHFGRAFRHQFGQSPTQYRRALRD
jgi:AraC-like DNA-binding protein